ncbi:hypothetical protein MtrunA17_Chr1g0195621 [Medicago truncatula]|uniref:Uncharacterized protein n=1 Tax=Medicago truncatula TaxID=3880 RepID=A0A396JXY0_MEDTR|nr:hypothetical protein MtrunA17_Chr1g0195621 [Medicago truncatula]
MVLRWPTCLFFMAKTYNREVVPDASHLWFLGYSCKGCLRHVKKFLCCCKGCQSKTIVHGQKILTRTVRLVLLKNHKGADQQTNSRDHTKSSPDLDTKDGNFFFSALI